MKKGRELKDIAIVGGGVSGGEGSPIAV